MTCPQCSGSMSPKQTPKGQVFECNQDNGTCLNAKGYPNSVWPKRGSAPAQAPAPTTKFHGGSYVGGSDDRSQRIERQHSQEMAIRWITLLTTLGVMPTEDASTPKKLRETIDFFQRDVGRTASATTATQQEPVPMSENADAQMTEGEEVF